MKNIFKSITLILMIGSFIFTSEVKAQLSGTINVGPGQTYTTPQAAISALVTNGINGPVVINLYDTTYNGTLSITSAITGISSTNTVTMQSNSGNPALCNATNNGYLQLNGNANYFRFKGIAFSSTNYSYGLYMTNATYNDIQFKNCTFVAVNYGIQFYNSICTNVTFDSCTVNNLNSGNYAMYFGQTCSGLTFTNCTIGSANSYYGIYFESSYGYNNLTFRGCNINSNPSATGSESCVYYQAGNSTAVMKNVRFVSNKFDGGAYNLYLYRNSYTSGYMDSVIVDSNTFTNAYSAAVYFYYNMHCPSISYNTIISRPGTTNTFYGIYGQRYITIDSLVGNKINVTSTSTVYGIYFRYNTNLDATYEASGPCFIANNEVKAFSSSNSAWGMYLYGSSSIFSRFNVLFNSIYAYCSSSTAYGIAMYPYNTSYTSSVLYNNIYVQSQSGTAYPIYSGSSNFNNTYWKVDSNNYYVGTSGATYYGRSDYTTLAAWKTGCGQEAASTNNLPSYVQTITTGVMPASLELSSSTGLTCNSVSNVGYDIDYVSRGTITTKGAYDAMQKANDVTLTSFVSPSGTTITKNVSVPITVSITNKGSNSLTSLKISYLLNGVQKDSNWTGSLASGSSMSVTLDNIYATASINYTIQAWASLPNGSADERPKDNSISKSVFACDTALYGTVYIGGTGATFATINQALTYINGCGVSGPLTFALRSGTYSEAVTINGTIPGSSATNTITFTSSAANADSVKIYVTGNTLTLTDAKYLRFNDITIGTLSTDGKIGVLFANSGTDIKFYRCNIYANINATSESYIPVYYSNSAAGKCLTDVKFIKNNIKGGFVNMCFFTSSSVGTSSFGSVTIDSNTMTEGYRGGFTRSVNSNQAYYMYFPSISYNTIIGRSGYSSWQYGICMGSTYQPPASGYNSYNDVVGQMVNNKIKLLIIGNYACGIQLPAYLNRYSSAGVDNAGTQCLIANNEIIHNSTDCYGYGIFGNSYPKANIINNSIYLKNTNTSYPLYGLYISNSSTTYSPMTIKNNNIVLYPQNPANGYPAYFSDGPAYMTTTYKIMDYNNYYSSGSIIGYIGSSIYDLPTWRSTTGQDAGTTSQLPSFVNVNNNLKVYGYNLACPSNTSVLNDIENTTRASNTIMGAYEFIPNISYDIQPYALVNPSTIVTAGINQSVQIKLMNVGTTTVTSATINWKFNNVAQTPVSWNGNISSGNSATVTLGNITPISKTNTLVITTSLPNGQADTVRFNDTLSVVVFACDSMLSGNYTVGTGGQFTTFTEAINAINSCGMSNAVTFNILSGTYNPLSISGSFKNSSLTNTVTFTSATGNAADVVIGNSTTSYTTALTVDRATNVIFKNLTIGLKTSYTGYGIELKGLCSNVLFYGCTIQTDSLGTGGNNIGVRYNGDGSATNYLSNVRFIKNTISGGYYNMYFYYGSGNNTPMQNKVSSIVVDSNNLINAYYCGLYISYNNRFPSISYNTIISRNNTGSQYYGIYSTWYNTIDTMQSNRINVSGTNNCYGMYFQAFQNYSTSYGANGPMFIANNEVIVKAGSNQSYAFYDQSNNGWNSRFDIFHNSFFISGTGTLYGIYIYPYDQNYKYTLKNNNVYVNTTGTGYMLYFGSTSYMSTNYCTIDYNNYYKPSGAVYYGSSSYSTLASWKSAYSQDANSTNIDPGFGTSPLNLVPSTWAMCPVLSSVNKDINGIPRVGITYKGCYTAVFNTDAAVANFVGIGPKVTAGTNSIQVRVVNYGTDTLKNVYVQCSVDGVTQTPVYLSGLTIPQYKDTIITIGSFMAVVSTNYNLKAWTYTPNGVTDQNIGNDTVSFTTAGCINVLNGTYDVAGGNNDFTTIAAALSALSSCGVSGPVTLRLASGTYTGLSTFNTVYSGTSATNTITFTSLTGNTNDVIIGNASGNATTFNGGKYLRFRNLTIGTNSSTTGITFSGSISENIEFYCCNIKSNPTNTSSTSYAGVYCSFGSGSSYYLKDIKFIKDTINGGYSNIYFNYPSGNTTNMQLMSVTIDSNVMQNAYYYGIYSEQYSAYPSISYNKITSRSTASTYYGIRIYEFSNIDSMIGNKINISATSTIYGMYLPYDKNNSSYGGKAPIFIANNELILQSSGGTVYGMYVYSGGQDCRYEVNNNSIYISNTSSAYGIVGYSTSFTVSTLIIRGNIVYINNPSSTCRVVYNEAGSAYLSNTNWLVDYNNWYRYGSGTTYYGYSSNTSFAAWKTSSNQDANSLNQDPIFLTPTTSLHTSGNNMLITPLSNVNKDADGKARIMITNMGCYHDFTPLALDAKMESIVSPAGLLTPGVSVPVSVKISNFGANTLDSVEIYWSANGGATSMYKWKSGPLASLTTSSTISLGNFIALSGSNSILVYVKNPNGSSDMNAKNDTLRYSTYACDSVLSAGTYTVGVGGYYSNELKLAAVLNNCGVSGPITVKFLSGTYGSLNLTNIPGASATNTITFTSNAGAADSVTIGSVSMDAIVLNTTKFLRFKDLTLGNTSSTTYGVNFIGMNEDVYFYGCKIQSSLGGTTSSNCGVYYSQSSGATTYLKNVRFIKNAIIGGYANFYFSYLCGNTTNMLLTSVTIDSNVLQDAYYYGIYSDQYSAYPSISYNKITARTGASTFYGMRIYEYSNIDSIIGNKMNISVNGTVYGMYIPYDKNNTSVYSKGPVYIANNELILQTTGGAAYGIYAYSGGQNCRYEIVNNSLYISNASTAYGIDCYSTSFTNSTIIIKGNIVYLNNTSSNTCYMVYNEAGASYLTNTYWLVDYNNWYRSGSGTTYYGYSSNTNFNSWKTASGQDANSLNQNPNFINPTLSLHTSGLNMLINPLSNVNKDIDGKARNIVTNMGCYHDLNPVALDAKVESIISPTTNMTIGVSTPIQVKIMNFGTTNIDSVKIYWTINGGTPNVYNWTAGPLIMFNVSSTISLGNFVPVSGFNTVKVYVSNPNGGTDLNTTNDTLSITSYSCDSLLSGVYTVGTGGNYKNEADVMAALTKCGIKGPVEFRFLSGNYGALSFASIPGGSTTNTVTFVSANGDPNSVSFIGSSTDDGLLLNVASNLIFDRVTIDASANTNGCGVKFMGYNNNIVFRGCNIKASTGATSSSSAAVYYNNSSSSTSYLQNVKFVNNKIDGGYSNFYLYYPAGTNTNMQNKTASITIDSNIMTNAYTYGIYTYYYGRFPSISYNSITSRSNTPSNYYGINSCYYITIDSMIGNKINITSASQSFGMYLGYYQNYNNTSYGADGPMFIANNEIRVTTTSNSYGFYDPSYSQYSRFDIYHNSIYVSGTSTQYGVFLSPYNSSYKINFLNNNIHVNTTSTAYMIYFNSVGYAGSSYCTINYNNYYSPASTKYYGSSSYTTLANWTSAYSQDANSVTVNPSYLNLNNSLEIAAAGNSGISCSRLSYVMNDLRKNLRSATTYMGCYEPYMLDAGVDTSNATIFAAKYQMIPVSAIIKNVGVNTLTNATIYWSFKDTVRIPIPWTGSLASGNSTAISLGSVFVTPGYVNNIKIWISNPNSSTDPNPSNDTISYSIFGCDTALRGIYTIGNNGADFGSIKEAMLSLTYCGMSGPITFMLQSGSYNDIIKLSSGISGLSASNTITFTSVANNPDSVQIYSSGSTVSLSSVSNIRFYNLTLGSTASTSGRTVYFEGSCSDIDFIGCKINTSVTATSNASCGVYYSQSSGVTTVLSDIHFLKNTLTGGYANFYFNYACGSNSYMTSNTTIYIDSNVMNEAYVYGLYANYYAYFPSISYNTIVTRNAGTTQYGLYLYYYCAINNMIGNKIKMMGTSSAFGIYFSIFNNQYVYTSNTKIYNNEIIIPQASSAYGIYDQVCKIEFYHNTIYLSGSGTNYGFYLAQTSSGWPFYGKNNMVACLTSNVNNGFPIYASSPSYVLTSSDCYLDYNNYYSAGNYLAYINSNIPTLALLRSATAQDVNSTNINPYFYDYPNSAKVYGLEMVAPQVGSIVTDINNVARASAATIGCYEFIPSLNLDIQPIALVKPGLVVSMGKKEGVSISLKNIGTDTIKTATINWKFNNVSRTPIVWNGILVSGKLVTVNLDTIIPISGTNTLTFVTSLPNNQTDAYVRNDTLKATLFACDSMLSGTYIVGTGGQFTSFDDAINSLNNCGIKGPVVFKFLSGVYSPISFIGTISGSSSTNTITLTSFSGNASDVTIGNSTTNSTTALTLDGASNLTFTNITIGLNSSYTGIAVDMKNMCDNILFYQCNIQTLQSATNSNYIGVRNNSTSGVNVYLKNVRFIKNNIDGGYYNFYFNYPAGNTTYMGSTGMTVTIDSNILTNSYYMGVSSQWYAHYPSISYNTITSRTSGSVTGDWYGMYLYYYHNVELITGNKIRSTNTSISQPKGIYIYQYYNYTGFYGTGSGLISNNEIILHGTYNSGNYQYFCGLYLYSPNANVNVYHNSIYLYRTSTGTTYGSCFYPYNTSTSYKINALNNNFVSLISSGTTQYIYPYYTQSNSYITSSYHVTDYNNYYNANNTIIAYASMDYTLANLQNANFQDANSTNMNPGFTTSSTNLVPVSWSMCPILTDVSNDINGDLRVGVTYKGCYTAIFNVDAAAMEFVGIGSRSTAGSNPVKVRVLNVGRNTLTSISIQYSIDGVLQSPVTLTGLSLAQYRDTVVTIGSFVATVSTTTKLKAWTYNPNGTTDQNYGNDTTSLSTVGCVLVLNGTYDVAGGNNDFATINDALTALNTCGVSGAVVLRLANGVYNAFNSISGSYYGTSLSKMITFTSLSGKVDSVIIGNNSGTAFSISNAKYIQFTNLTIGTNANSYGVYFSNTNENINFYQCKINADSNTITSNYAAVYYSNSGSGHTYYLKNINFIKNTINGGYHNFYFYYPTGNTSYMNSMSVNIDSNIIKNAYQNGIYSYEYGYFPSISYNTITSRSSGSVSSWYGINLQWYNAVNTIVGNKIKSTNTNISSPIGIYIYYYLNSDVSNRQPLIANNEIILYSASGNYGIGLWYPYSNVQLLHNSVYMYGSGNPNGLYLYNSTTSYKPVIKNNIFATAAGTNAYPINYTNGYYDNTYFTVDYNNYYSTGQFIGYTNAALSTLAALQSTTRQDANSLNVNPNFLAPTTNLHTNGMEMLVDPMALVPKDLSNVSRVPVTNMGCYQDFVPKNYDVKMLAIVNPTSSVSTGQTTPIQVKIKNFGTNNLDSVKIHYVVNGIENIYNWIGSLAFNVASDEITVGNFIPLSGINTIKVFTTSPNGVQDQFTKNDTLGISVYGCDSMLHGIYTVGTSGNFADEQTVISALNNCGINGPVEFRFISGNYGALNFNKAITGSSSTNTILFTSVAGYAASVSFVATTGNALTLNGINNIYFRYVTINGAAANNGVEIQGSCNNIEFYGCNILASPTTTSSPLSAIYRSGSQNSSTMLSNIRIINNTISGGYYNIYWTYGGGSSSYMGLNCVIDSNTLSDAYYGGMYLYNSYTNFSSISNNAITARKTNASSNYYGIYMLYYNNVDYLVGNKIKIINSSINYAYPIYNYYYNNYTNNSYGPMLIANNEIIVKVGNYCEGGIYNYSYSSSEIINNSIYISSTSRAYGLNLYMDNSAGTIIAKNNNIFTATATTNYPLYIQQAGQVYNMVLDYNNYASTGNYVGYVGLGQTSLAALRATTYQDTHSVSVQPVYVDSSSLEMTDYSGIVTYRLNSVLNDINGKARKLLTPMGAYTVDIYEGYDIAINSVVEPINTSNVFCYQDFASVRLAVQNKGSYMVDFSAHPITFHVEASGAVTYQYDTVITLGGLTPTQKDTISVTNLLPVSKNGLYNIKVWMSLDADTLYYDDTIQSSYVIDKIILPYAINFDSVPRGMVFKKNVGVSEWHVVQGVGTSPTIAPSHGTGRLEFTSSYGKGSSGTATLQPINLQGTAKPKLDFWYAHDDVFGRDYTDVKISIDGGFTYKTILNIQRYNSSYTTPTFVHYQVDLSAYSSYACVIIAFEAGSFGTGNQNIDSISVTSKEDLLVGLDLPDQSDFVACELDHKKLSVNISNMTSQDFNFTTKPTQLNVTVTGAITKNYSFPLTSGLLKGDSIKTIDVDTNFSFSTNGTYQITALLKSVDDNKLNDTAKATRIINVDVAVRSISPIGIKQVGDKVYPTIVIKNNSNMPVNTIPLRLQINNGSDLTETVSHVFNPGDSLNYTFVKPFTVPAVSEAQPYYKLEIKSELSCDGIASNNAKSDFYQVALEEFIDLTIASVEKPDPAKCDSGFTVVYPVVKIKNIGTQIANNIMVYVTVDSAGTILKSYSESITYLLGQDSIKYTFTKGYIVPNFSKTYTVTIFANVADDKDVSNNTKEIIACAVEKVGIPYYNELNWTMEQNIPNPATSSVKIPYSLPKEGNVTFKVMSINGQVLYKESINAANGSQELNFNTSMLASGIYYYSMEYQGQRIVKKMTIQK